MADLRALTIALLVSATLFTMISAFVFQFLGQNNVNLPSSANFTNQNFYKAVNNSITGTAINARTNLTGTSSVQGYATAPQASIGLIGDFMVFGGIIVGLFGYMVTIPFSLLQLENVIGSPIGTTSAISVVVTAVGILIGGLVVSSVLVIMIYEYYSAIMKYRS